MPAGPDWHGADTDLTLAGDITVELLGTPHRIASTTPAAAHALASLLEAFPPARAPASPMAGAVVVERCGRHDAPWCVHRAGEAVHAADDLDATLAWLLVELNRAALDGYTGFAAHAGVVARGHRAIAFPARSGAGKTTLTAAAAVAGFSYVSDEALCVDFDTAAVVPYRRALVLSPWSRSAAGLDAVEVQSLGVGEIAIPPSRLGGEPPPSPLRLSDVVVMERRPGPPALVPAPRAEAMAWLLELSFNHYKRPAESFGLCATLARQACAWRLGLSDPADAAALLLERLGREEDSGSGPMASPRGESNP